MTTPKRSVLITGCSEGGLGAALAVAFHIQGLKVYATARNPAKMQLLASLGIETLTLDVQSAESIAACVAKVPSLDILVNNAGGQYLMPVADIDIAEAKKIFDLNVWSYIAVTQAFLPLLLKSPKPMIVNQTSVVAVLAIPFQSIYNASKAAIASISDAMRLELQPFGVVVVDLRTGLVRSNIMKNSQETWKPELPKGSIYEPVRELAQRAINQEGITDDQNMDSELWAKKTVQDLLKNKPPPQIWRGGSAWISWFTTLLPFGWTDSYAKKLTGIDKMEEIFQKK